MYVVTGPSKGGYSAKISSSLINQPDLFDGQATYQQMILKPDVLTESSVLCIKWRYPALEPLQTEQGHSWSCGKSLFRSKILLIAIICNSTLEMIIIYWSGVS